MPQVPAQASADENMHTTDIEAIEHALAVNRGHFPVQAVRAAIQQREAVTPILLAALEAAADDPEALQIGETKMLHISSARTETRSCARHASEAEVSSTTPSSRCAAGPASADRRRPRSRRTRSQRPGPPSGAGRSDATPPAPAAAARNTRNAACAERCACRRIEPVPAGPVLAFVLLDWWNRTPRCASAADHPRHRRLQGAAWLSR